MIFANEQRHEDRPRDPSLGFLQLCSDRRFHLKTMEAFEDMTGLESETGTGSRRGRWGTVVGRQHPDGSRCVRRGSRAHGLGSPWRYLLGISRLVQRGTEGKTAPNGEEALRGVPSGDALRALRRRRPDRGHLRRERVNIRGMSSTDFMPIKGWDHLELYVGNAKQSAYFYEHAFGFTQTAYAGPETGLRDRASYVSTRTTSGSCSRAALRPDSEITRFACSHGDGVKDVALDRPDATEATARRCSAARGASSSRTGSRTTTAASSSRRSRPTARTSTRSSNRDDYAGPYLPGYTRSTENGSPATGIGLQNIDHVVGNVELGRMERLGRVLRAASSA